jgi:hypothetical protein
MEQTYRGTIMLTSVIQGLDDYRYDDTILYDTYQNVLASVIMTALSGDALCRRPKGDEKTDTAERNSRRATVFSIITGYGMDGWTSRWVKKRGYCVVLAPL